jgi:hypothetical protein
MTMIVTIMMLDNIDDDVHDNVHDSDDCDRVNMTGKVVDANVRCWW